MAHAWRVSCIDGGAGPAKWTLVKGERIVENALSLGDQNAKPYLPPLSQFLRDCNLPQGEMAEEWDPVEEEATALDLEKNPGPGASEKVDMSPLQVGIYEAGITGKLGSSEPVQGSLDLNTLHSFRELDPSIYGVMPTCSNTVGKPSKLSAKGLSTYQAGPYKEDDCAKKVRHLRTDLETGVASMFQTFSGKIVAVDNASMKKARALLDDITEDFDISGRRSSTYQNKCQKQASVNPQSLSHALATGTKFSNDCLPGMDSLTSDTGLSGSVPTSCGTEKTEIYSPVERGFSLLAAQARKKLDVSSLAIERAQALLEKGSCAESVENGESRIPSIRVRPGDTAAAHRCNVPELVSKQIGGHSSSSGKNIVDEVEGLCVNKTITEARSAVHLSKPSSPKRGENRGNTRSFLESESPSIKLHGSNFASTKVESLHPGSGLHTIESVPKLYQTSIGKGGSMNDIPQKSRLHPTLQQGWSGGAFKVPRRQRPTESQLQEGDVTARKAAPVGIAEECSMPKLPETFCNTFDANVLSKQKTAQNLKQVRQVKSNKILQTKMRGYYGDPPGLDLTVKHADKEVIGISPENAELFKIKEQTEYFGAEDFRNVLHQAGANPSYATTEWVANHYKWIIWKLASHERSYPRQAAGKLLTRQRVLSELLNRYYKEYRDGHRSAFKRITERDSPSSQMMVVCISSISKRFAIKSPDDCFPEADLPNKRADLSECLPTNGRTAWAIELTDGWYRMNAILDPLLNRQLQNGKMFVGQKLRVCGAVFNGYAEGLPPLEAFPVSTISLHINGTFRAHWADRLGFCHAVPPPLALKCVKANGGHVSSTLVVVARVYPVLFRERLKNGRSVVRSARAEDKAAIEFEERRLQIIEDAKQKLEQDCHKLPSENELVDEGARLFFQIARAGERELELAKMTRAEQQAFAAFHLKRQIAIQMAAEKSIHRALEDAELVVRDVIPFLRIRVHGLEHKEHYSEDVKPEDNSYFPTYKEGLVTVWKPSEDQVSSIKEGSVYQVSDIIAGSEKFCGSFESGTVDLVATNSTKWRAVSVETAGRFLFHYAPRRATRISSLEQITAGREFDVACLVLHVGEVYQSGFHLRQWIFLVDGSHETDDGNRRTPILAVEHFCSTDVFKPFEPAMLGSVVAYCNLKKRCRDHDNSLWIAEASQVSIYSSKLTSDSFRHLRGAGEFVRRWASESSLEIQCLRETIVMELIK